MKRRKFFRLASSGVAGAALSTSCRNSGSGAGNHADNQVIKEEIPDYRSTIKTVFPSAKSKAAEDKVILALIGAGSWGTSLILEAAKSGENIQIRYVCDVDDTRGGYAISEEGF